MHGEPNILEVCIRLVHDVHQGLPMASNLMEEPVNMLKFSG